MIHAKMERLAMTTVGRAKMRMTGRRLGQGVVSFHSSRGYKEGRQEVSEESCLEKVRIESK